MGTKARYLADLLDANGNVTAEVTGDVHNLLLNEISDLPDVRPSLLLDFANSKSLGPVDFTRAATATYWDGKTNTKAEQNLHGVSSFDTEWQWHQGATAIHNTLETPAPDNTFTATKLYPSVTNTYVGLYANNGAKPNRDDVPGTVSIYAKAGGKNYIQAYVYSADGNALVHFDLANGVVGDVGTGITASIVDIGNGWYRCIASHANLRSYWVQWSVNDVLNTNTATPNGTDGIYIWGAQAEERSFAASFIETTGKPITRYQPAMQTAAADQARFDHDPLTGESKGLLIEEQRTNLASNSNPNDGGWSSMFVSSYANELTAPDGTETAMVFRENTSSAPHRIYKSFTFTNGTVYTISAYVKYAGSRYITIAPDANLAGDPRVFYDLIDGTVAAVKDENTTLDKSITDVGNGWYRITHTVIGDTAGTLYFELSDNTSSISYVGNGWRGAAIWGIQVEEGSFATSYIPTNGSQVTRDYDSAIVNNFYEYGDPISGVTLFAESSKLYEVSSYTYLGVLETGTAARMLIRASTTAGSVHGYANRETAAYTASYYVSRDTTSSKFALAIKTDDMQAAGGGTLFGADDNANVERTYEYFRIGSSGPNNEVINGHVQKISYYPTRLPNTALQAITKD